MSVRDAATQTAMIKESPSYFIDFLALPTVTTYNSPMDDLFSTTDTLVFKGGQSNVGTSDGRPDDDFYPTPPEATEARLRVEKFEGSMLASL